MEQHQPRLCQETEMLKIVRPGPTDSPPPNCAICLGICTNKCFTDCCLHQFCFSCLLEWSKIKAECPLCKQPFKSIIYNIKSNLEYEEHIITNSEDEVQGEDLHMDGDIDMRTGTEYLILPQRQFQYRTTFTLAPGREFAIQQLLRSHPRTNSSTNSIYLHGDRYVHHRLLNPNPHSLQLRRNVYSQGLWVDPQPDVTGRFRECSPGFFRENPAQIHRIVPWLNRELAALLSEYIDFYHIEEQILEMLCQYSIRSASFRNRIVFYLGNRTDHFIHEFYNFARSPFDMIGYDRHSIYTEHPPPVYSQSVSDDDSDDVRVVDSPSNDDCIYVPPRTPEVIIIDSDSSSDSDVIIRNPSPVATPPVVNLIDSDSDDNNNVANQQPVAENNERTETNNRSPQLPIKIRYKRNRNSAEIVHKKHKDKQHGKGKRCGSDSDSYEDSDYAESHHPKSESDYSTTHFSTSSSSSSSSSESSSSSSSSSSDKKYVQSLILKRVKSKSRKRKSSYKTYKSNKYRNKKPSNSTREESSERNYRIKRKKSKSKKSKRKSNDSGYHNHHRNKRMKKIKIETNYFSSERFSGDSSDDNDSCTRKHAVKEERSFSQLFDPSFETKPEPDPEPTGSESLHAETNEQSDCDRAQDLDMAGPSQGPSLRSVIVRGNKKWYSRPELEDTTTDNNSD